MTVSVADPLAALPFIGGTTEILSEHKMGRQVRWVLRGFDPTVERSLADSPGVQSVRSRPATLEELFIACTRGVTPGSADDVDLPMQSTFGSTGATVDHNAM